MYLRKVKSGSFSNLMRCVAPVILIGSLAPTASVVRASAYTESVNLGVAAEYSIVAGSAISIGTSTVLTGETISGVSGATSGPWMAATLASGNAAARTATSSSGATNLPVNRTVTPGVYRYTSYMLATGEITLDAQNDPNAVFVFQIGGYLSTEAGFRVLLTNGTNPANVFWQVDSYFSPGASTSFKGIVMAGSYVTTGAAMTLNGKMFALGGAVTIGASNVITDSVLSSNSATPTGTPLTPTGTPSTPAGTPTGTNSLSLGGVPGGTNGTNGTNGANGTIIFTSSKDTMHLVDGNLQILLRGVGTTGKFLVRGRNGILNLRFGGSLQIRQAKGFAPNSLVRVSMLSPTRLLRTFRTNSLGTFSGSVYLPSSNHSGVRMLKVTGYKTTGAFRTLWVRAQFPSSKSTHSGNCHIHITKTLVRAC